MILSLSREMEAILKSDSLLSQICDLDLEIKKFHFMKHQINFKDQLSIEVLFSVIIH